MQTYVDPAERESVLAACERFVSGHRRRPVREALSELAAWTDPAAARDHYGRGEVVEGFERDVARMLGKEAAVFMPSGTMAQQIALRLWCDRAGSRRVAFHPTCHLELHEEHAYRELHGLEAALVGPADRLMTVADLDEAFDSEAPPAALLVELPQREIGGQLPAWDDLTALVDRARSLGARLHLDGARLWECGPVYGRDYAEIAALFDSVYVSFYKGLGGIAGAALAGPADLVAASRVWLRRHGGNLVSLYPYVLAARMGLEQRLPRMGQYREAALAVAGAIRPLEGVRVVPDPPHTHMMHVAVAREPEPFARAALEAARETKVWLANAVWPAPDGCGFELTAGDATLELAPAEIAAVLSRALDLARAR
jgi:threonine aldolase